MANTMANRRARPKAVGVSSLAVAGLMLALPLLVVPAVSAQEGTESPLIHLHGEGLGPYGKKVSTASAEAQAYFDQGLQFLYAFSMGEAALSFREAQRLDPTCAMCFWGEAVALGPNLNAGMRPASAPAAYAAARESDRLAARNGTEVERALARAISVRYRETHDPLDRPGLDRLYAAAMAEAYAAHPRDPEVATAYADALMLLDARRGLYSSEDPSVRRIHEVLEGVLARDLTHPGACHLYVHATEATDQPEKAAACAEHLAATVPGSSHMNHMPSHTYNRIGRWGDAVRANIDAWHADQLAASGEGVSYGAAHNLHMLLFSASMDGQGAIAAQAARDYTRLVPDGEFYVGMVLVRFGRFEEILGLQAPPTQVVHRGLWDFARGYAHLRLGARDSALVHVEAIEQAAASLPPGARWGRPGGSASFREAHSAQGLLGIASRILRAEILKDEGRPEDAIPLLEEAVALDDELGYDEPEPLVFSARHWLGAFLLEAGRPEAAERVYLDALEQHRHNGWSLFGLERALRSQGRSDEADEVRARFHDAWQRSDTLLRSSRF
jgi:tetratricopeptide (TPR) repeat protein